MKIVVTGGTGTLGRHVVPLLREAGAEVTVLSRHERAELSDLLAIVDFGGTRRGRVCGATP
ncbi:NAD-dependent epimerase/dehydratase family protein [Lentzea sp. NPDC058436]|uniref:NAD-dependent epimerase/dehydratase family protein n=1 Tax=Lentzea sp. NPDC058436 TaxID=3346499 RepID=UPI0036612178